MEDDKEYTGNQPSAGQETLGLLCTLCHLLFKYQNWSQNLPIKKNTPFAQKRGARYTQLTLHAVRHATPACIHYERFKLFVRLDVHFVQHFEHTETSLSTEL